MRKICQVLGFVATMLLASPAVAQDKLLFDHLAIGAEVGTTGWGFEAAMPLTQFVTFRTGFTTLPRFNVKFDIDYKTKGEQKNVDVSGRVHMTDYKFLVDIYPFKHSSFHVTGGFYAGLPDLGTVRNVEPLEVDEGEGFEIGDVFVRPDEYNTAHLKLQTKSFKPYAGLGFGRPVSTKHKVSVAFDLGVQFWGTPALKVYSPDEQGWIKMKKDDIEDKDFHDAVKIINRVKVYPVLNLRIYCNVF